MTPNVFFWPNLGFVFVNASRTSMIICPGKRVYDLSTVRQQLELSVVGLTNTTVEEMAGVFPLAIRDAIYRAIA